MERGFFNPNQELENKRIKAISVFLDSAKKDLTKERRNLRRKQLREMIEKSGLDLEDLREIEKKLNVDLKIGENFKPMDMVNVLLPEIKEEVGKGIEVIEIDETLVETNGQGKVIEKGSGTFKEKELIPRTNIIINFLIENGVEEKDVKIIKGKNKPNMMRYESYNMIMLPDLSTMIMVCDEEGNATFVINEYEEEEPERYYRLTKDELKNTEAHPEIESLNWGDEEKWKMRILDIITMSEEQREEERKKKNNKKKKEKKEKKVFLSYNQLIDDVKFMGVNSESNYREEQKKHSDWPAAPNRIYKNKGWESWPELFGREKKEFPTFDQFVKEVRESGIKTPTEYAKVYKNHHGWPSHPDKTYKNKGWVDFDHLLCKKKLSFDQFVKEVRESGIKNSVDYKKEYENHHGWRSNPSQFYKNKGWVDFDHLLDKEKKVFSTFDQFVKEVREAGIKTPRHYEKEYKNHSGWYSNPNESYKDKGWSSWPELFGREKKAFLSFDQFVEEVRASNINTKDEYGVEQKNHSDWPSTPNRTYKNEGWESWPELFGKNK